MTQILKELLIIVAVVLIGSFLLDDLMGNHIIADKKLSRECAPNMRRLGDALAEYRSAHDGQLPADVDEFRPFVTSGMLGYHSSPTYTYVCWFSGEDAATEIVCWDIRPHGGSHRIFRWKNRPYRNVLYADGTVREVSEEEFQRLELAGKPLTSL